MKTIQLQQGVNPQLVDRTLTYDPAGNATSIADAVNGETITYGYDALNRLTSASAPAGESYTYDVLGDVTVKGGSALTYGDANHKHAVTGYNGTSYAYDANGNMTTRGAQAIAYDTANRPVRVDSGATIARFAYDGDGMRRKRLDANGTIHYVGAYERNLGGNGSAAIDVVTKYYKATFGSVSRLIAFRKGGTLNYVGTDHLGGTIRVTDANFTAVDGMRYTPFGIARDAGTSLSTDHRFTSQVQDAAVGLYWYGSRAYDSAIGRFSCPDTVVPSTANPQALNRYAYALNKPLRLVDPSGHDSWDPNWVGAFQAAHNGQSPSGQDWKDYQFSLNHSGSGPNGTWTADDWKTFTDVKDTLSSLLQEVGRPQDDPSLVDLVGPTLISGSNLSYELQGGWDQGPDGTRILRGEPPAGHRAITLGGTIVVARNRHFPVREWRSLIAHEYTHVLQYRTYGLSFLERCKRPSFSQPTAPIIKSRPSIDPRIASSGGC